MNTHAYTPSFDDAAVLTQTAVDTWRQILARAPEERHDPVLEQALRSLVKRGLYEHFKSKPDDPKFYVVEGVRLDVNAKIEPLVPYEALYAPHAGEEVFRSLVDPEDCFWGPIDRADWRGPRFMFIRELSIAEAAILKVQSDLISIYRTREAVLAKIERELEHVPPLRA